eukprot:TRINITY_DN62895_c0_g1_i1.p2 TRINITY_DN62895_c0_g1~~TRINITY_DN62895_c0_g1_i1.p2  ORF type:complete len:171 (-),score=27.71 TRINITY_DN62895_c0_g1_i1:149-661(-)
MAATAPWRDHRFAHAQSRSHFEQSFHPGATHGLMQAAGFATKPQEHIIQASRPPVRANEPPASLKLLEPAHTIDPRFPAGSSLGPRYAPLSAGLEWRRRRTQELDYSRGCGGGNHCAVIGEMRPAGVSTKRRGEVCMNGWHAYKQTVRNLEQNGEKLVASCPDLRALVAA